MEWSFTFLGSGQAGMTEIRCEQGTVGLRRYAGREDGGDHRAVWFISSKVRFCIISDSLISNIVIRYIVSIILATTPHCERARKRREEVL